MCGDIKNPSYTGYYGNIVSYISFKRISTTTNNTNTTTNNTNTTTNNTNTTTNNTTVTIEMTNNSSLKSNIFDN
jgi:hypothetical protein